MRLIVWSLLFILSSAYACNTTHICKTLDTYRATVLPLVANKPDIETSLSHLETTCTKALNTWTACDGRNLCENLILQLWLFRNLPDLPYDVQTKAREMQTFCSKYISNVNDGSPIMIVAIMMMFMLLAALL